MIGAEGRPNWKEQPVCLLDLPVTRSGDISDHMLDAIIKVRPLMGSNVFPSISTEPRRRVSGLFSLPRKRALHR